MKMIIHKHISSKEKLRKWEVFNKEKYKKVDEEHSIKSRAEHHVYTLENRGYDVKVIYVRSPQRYNDRYVLYVRMGDWGKFMWKMKRLKVKKFGGVDFFQQNYWNTKAKAQKAAEEERERGFYVRIVPIKAPHPKTVYFLYTRRKSHGMKK